METFEIEYFVETAKLKSVRKASESIGISPSAISKAITRLESELETKLIGKVGRNLVLTRSGKQFATQGAELLALKRQIIESHNKLNNNPQIRIVGPELPLSHWGTEMTKRIIQKHPQAKINFTVTTNDEALEMVSTFDADFALYTSKKPMQRDKSLVKKMGDFSLKTFISEKHSLSMKSKVPIQDIIQERFALTNSKALSLFEMKDAKDGWRDDKFKREQILITDSLKSLDSILLEGLAISYLPDFYGKKLGLKELKISNCPYTCSMSVYLCRNKYGLNDVWSLF